MNPMCILTALAGVVLACEIGCSVPIRGVETNPAGQAQKLPEPSFDSKVDRSSASLLFDGRKIFRFETFGSEDLWSAQLQLHRAIASQRYGGIGPGLSPRQALQCFELGEGLFDRVQVGTVRRQVEQAGAGGLARLADAGDLM